MDELYENTCFEHLLKCGLVSDTGSYLKMMSLTDDYSKLLTI